MTIGLHEQVKFLAGTLQQFYPLCTVLCKHRGRRIQMGFATKLQAVPETKEGTPAAVCMNVSCQAVLSEEEKSQGMCQKCGSFFIETCPHCHIPLTASSAVMRFCSTCGGSLRREGRQQRLGLQNRPTLKFVLFMSLAAVGTAALYSDPTFRYCVWVVAAMLLATGWYLGNSGLYFDPQDDPDARRRWLGAACNLAGTYLLVVCTAELLLVVTIALCTGQAGRLPDLLR
jgi:hypothetical protein